jgi:hypothetical protein
MCLAISFNAIQNVILLFPHERPVFLREVGNHMYSVSSYFLAKVISEIPASIITPILYGGIVYYAVGFNSSGADVFLMFCKSICILSIMNSAGHDISILRRRKLRPYCINNNRRQIIGCHFHTHTNNSIYVVLWILRQLRQHSKVFD